MSGGGSVDLEDLERGTTVGENGARGCRDQDGSKWLIWFHDVTIFHEVHVDSSQIHTSDCMNLHPSCLGHSTTHFATGGDDFSGAAVAELRELVTTLGRWNGSKHLPNKQRSIAGLII